MSGEICLQSLNKDLLRIVDEVEDVLKYKSSEYFKTHTFVTQKSVTRNKYEIENVLENDDNDNEIEQARKDIQNLKENLSKANENLASKTKNALYYKTEYEKMRFKFINVSQERRQLHEQIVTLQGNIRVFCRIKTLSQNDKSLGLSYRISEQNLLVHAINDRQNNKNFRFTSVFGSSSNQIKIFKDVEPFIKSVIDGYNVCLLAYGQTGSGKTYTMQGTDHDPGINYRALDMLFKKKYEDIDELTINISTSIFEIYNNKVYDLLDKQSYQNLNSLNVRISKDEEVYVDGLTAVECVDFDKTVKLIKEAEHARTIDKHAKNDTSSRSHYFVQFHILTDNKLTKQHTKSTLALVDLAGSERMSKTKVDGKVLKESKHINKSLAALCNVFEVLYQRRKDKRAFIPFRDSTLTFLLKNYLKPNSGGKVAAFVTISPLKEDYDETISSLKFADRCSSVVLGKAKRNQR